MREIKFRGKRVDNGEWVYGSIDILPDETVLIRQHSGIGEWAEVDTVTVGQFAGIADKNERLIFEGDIVRCIELNGGGITEYTSPVFWVGCGFLVRESENCDCDLSMFDGAAGRYPLTEIEVIGNIHDNPALLGGDGDA